MVPAGRAVIADGAALTADEPSQVKVCGMVLKPVPLGASGRNERNGDDHIRLPGRLRRHGLAFHRVAKLPLRAARITSGTHTVTVNENTGYVSLTTGGSTWGYLGSGNSYLPTLTAARVSATNVNATLLQVGTGNGAACDASRRGAMRYSAVSSTMEYCNSTAWVSMGPSETIPISFRAHKSAGQTVTAGVETKVTYDQTIHNHGGGFSNSTFTAPVAGVYAFTATVYCRTGTTYCMGSFWNGSGYIGSSFVYTTEGIVNLSTIVFLNAGSTIEVRATNGGGTLFAGGGGSYHFAGSLLGPQGGGSGGGSDNLGNHTATQDLDMGAYNIVGTGTVSMTNVSATHLQLNSPTTIATCDAAMLGTMRRNASTGLLEVCQ